MRVEVPNILVIAVSIPLIIVMTIGIIPILDDESFAVRGRIVGVFPGEQTSCKLAFVTEVDPLLGEKGTMQLNPALVRNSFEFGWVTRVRESKVWIEISCPGHEMFRSPKFVSPGLAELDLGDIWLVPLAERGK